ncbi:GNAT family N-acetyltransferase [Allosphingosinicella deserti]|uniref:GNAT family N-acetyltransferase n=1 Tax=Allosphingosinicella deserti TaxID=2116704 RepID=A0A2P7QZ92_9SPHN|nr:GNAT family N-acetyltransferase [Sphingomonas deserti]PSJ43281.1 GNAT family N-acetyltransferase [Sphingomonas deserti]
MGDADRDKMLRDMAANRGCRLVKSRRRTPGVGDYGHYGLKDAASDTEIFGFGPDGLTASPEAIESFLRKGLVADWKSSLAAAEPAPQTKSKPRTDNVAPEATQAARPRAAKDKRVRPAAEPPPTPPPPPPPSAKPKLRIVESAVATVPETGPPPPDPPRVAPPPPAPPPPSPSRPILKIRDARPADAQGLAALLGDTGDAKTIAVRISAQRKAGEPPLVAEEDGAILGCLAWHALPLLQRDAPLGRITFLHVAPPARRRGIGRALVEEAEARLADAGCTRVEALAEIEIGAAPDFFRRLGWTRATYRYARDLDV